MRLFCLLPVLTAGVFAFQTIVARGEEFTPPASSRVITNLSGEWKFTKTNTAGAETPDFDDTAWEKVTVPHTWNNLDGQDGNDGKEGRLDFYKGACWYRRHVNVDKIEGRIAYLKFDGANRTTTAYVNGKEIGTHTGGFAAFAFDATRALKAGDNVIAVKVDNTNNPDSPPLSGDFTFFGGLYRNVSLITMTDQAAHISPLESGSSGVFLKVSDVKPDSANVELKVFVRVPPHAAATNVNAEILDADGKSVATQGETIPSTDSGNEWITRPVTLTLAVKNPHLWAGTPDPYLYQAKVDLTHNHPATDAVPVSDQVTLPFGIRTMEFNPEKGFLLNGKKYDLHGVCRHQDWKNMGWAIGPKQMDADMALLKELGITTIRLAHYQHDQYFYDLCDKNGIVVWAELAMVNAVNDTAAFKDNAKQQLTELIYQNMHHPSIAMWSMGNEVIFKNKGPSPYPFIGELSDLSHKLDPTRVTVQAIMDNPPPDKPFTDLDAHNTYMGWYYGKLSELPGYIEKHPFFAMSEFGAGANPSIHAETPKQMDHSEEFQCFWHETYWRAMRNQPHIWGTYIWAFADFASDGRTEGGFYGRNDKGLLTYDRAIKKDLFYFYKAQWSSEPTLYITSRRFAVRGQAKVPAKIYTNASEAELFVNGASVGKQTADMGICLWPEITLKEGENKIETKATIHGKEVTDAITWTYQPGAPKLTKPDSLQ